MYRKKIGEDIRSEEDNSHNFVMLGTFFASLYCMKRSVVVSLAFVNVNFCRHQIHFICHNCC